MPNLQKIVKVTQAQYDTLSSGGTVGSYTGLNDNYVYLVENNTEYLPTTGGSMINYGWINFNDDEDNTRFVLGGDWVNNEIIYLSDNTGYMPLFADDGGEIIYSQNSDYHSDTTVSTCLFTIKDVGNTDNYIQFEPETRTIYFSTDSGQHQYNVSLPSADGTIALTSDIPSVSLTTTTGSESITVGSNSLNVVTRDTAQTIDGQKTFSSFPIAKGITLKNNVLNPTGSNFEIANDNGYNGKIRFGGKGLMFTAGNVLPSENNNSQKLGDTAYKWKAVYIDGYLGKQNANYGVSLPDMTNWTANKELATIDEIPQVKRYI